MRIDIDRLCELAGLQHKSSNSRRSSVLKESYDPNLDTSEEFEMPDEDLPPTDIGDDDIVLEIDEAELVQELRRAKRIMQEAKKKSVRRRNKKKQYLQEMQLKAVIDKEVKNVLSELDLNLGGGWVYGNKRPTKSKKGYLNQGNIIKSIGFK